MFGHMHVHVTLYLILLFKSTALGSCQVLFSWLSSTALPGCQILH